MERKCLCYLGFWIIGVESLASIECYLMIYIELWILIYLGLEVLIILLVLEFEYVRIFWGKFLRRCFF